MHLLCPCLFLLLTLLNLIFPLPSLSNNFDSDSYHIDMGNFNMTSGTKNSSNYTITDTVGQTASGQYDSSGFTVKSGFQYIYTIIPFSFSISDLSIDLGVLSSGSLSNQTNQLTVSARGAGGYQVLAFESHPLRFKDNDIPDTTCDDGTCTESLCRPWTQNDTYGFGFNIEGDDVDTSAEKFVDSTYFCQFTDQEQSESSQPVMSKNSPGRNRTATITYQANPPPLQEAGNYETAITFIAVPKY